MTTAPISTENYTPLEVSFVNTRGDLIRKINTSCILYRDESRTRIELTDSVLIHMLDIIYIDFFDHTYQRFLFKCNEIGHLINDKFSKPKCIYLEVMDILGSEFVILSPGIWCHENNGRIYRIRDDNVLYDHLAKSVSAKGLSDPEIFKREFFRDDSIDIPIDDADDTPRSTKFNKFNMINTMTNDQNYKKTGILFRNCVRKVNTRDRI